MLPDRVSNPGPLTYESGALPIALRGPARAVVSYGRKYVHLVLNTRMDDLRLYVLFNSISVISGQ